MFCEKCGNKLSDDVKFCEKCGAPIPEITVNPVTSQPSPDPVSPADSETTAIPENSAAPEASANSAANPYLNVQSAATSVAVKKPVPKKAIICIAAALAVIIAAIITFTAIIPALTKVEIKDFISFKFDSEEQYDGYASGRVYFNAAKFCEKYFPVKDMDYSDEDKVESEYEKYISTHPEDTEKWNAFDSINDYYSISISKKGDEDGEKNYGYSLDNIKKDDVYVVKITWNVSPMQRNVFKSLEKDFGHDFDTEDTTVEISVSDEIDKQKIKFSEPTTINPFDYMIDKNYIHTSGCVDGDLDVYFDSFEIKDKNYVLKYTKLEKNENRYYSSNSSSQNCFYIYDENGDEITTQSFVIQKNDENDSYSDNDGYSTNDTLSFAYSNTDKDGSVFIESKGLVLAKGTKSYTVKANEPLTLEAAKQNLDNIKKAYNAINTDETTKENIVAVYFCESNNSEHKNMLVVITKKKTTGWFGSEYYEYRENAFYDLYASDNLEEQINKSTQNSNYITSMDTKEDKPNEALKQSRFANDKNYKITKIL